jgi:hypothetical protein
MWSRFQEYITVVDGIQQNELGNYTALAWKTWYNQWRDYIVDGTLVGGQHPPNRPI